MYYTTIERTCFTTMENKKSEEIRVQTVFLSQNCLLRCISTFTGKHYRTEHTCCPQLMSLQLKIRNSLLQWMAQQEETVL